MLLDYIFVQRELDREKAMIRWTEDLVIESVEDADQAIVFGSRTEREGDSQIWSVKGSARLTPKEGEQPVRYAALMEQICDDFDKRSCWRLIELSVDENVLLAREDAAQPAASQPEEAEVAAVEPTEDRAAPVQDRPAQVVEQVVETELAATGDDAETVPTVASAEDTATAVADRIAWVASDGETAPQAVSPEIAPLPAPKPDLPEPRRQAKAPQPAEAQKPAAQVAILPVEPEIIEQPDRGEPPRPATGDASPSNAVPEAPTRPTPEPETQVATVTSSEPEAVTAPPAAADPHEESKSGASVEPEPEPAPEPATQAETASTPTEPAPAQTAEAAPQAEPQAEAEIAAATARSEPEPARREVAAPAEPAETRKASPEAEVSGAAASLIYLIQVRLNTLGYGKPGALTPDGVMGPKTQLAIKAFQAVNGLDEDGQATPVLLAQLEKQVLAKQRGESPPQRLADAPAEAVETKAAVVEPTVVKAKAEPKTEDVEAPSRPEAAVARTEGPPEPAKRASSPPRPEPQRKSPTPQIASATPSQPVPRAPEPTGGGGLPQIASTTVTGDPGPSTLRVGEPASSILFLIQDRLNRLGYGGQPPLQRDGQLGPRTQKAIEAYQRDHQLPANGRPSMDLLRHMEGQLGERAQQAGVDR